MEADSLVPYASQVQLGTFDVSRVLKPSGFDLRFVVPTMVSHPSLTRGGDSRSVSFVAPVQRTNGKDHVIVTIGQEIRPELPGSGDYGLLWWPFERVGSGLDV